MDTTDTMGTEDTIDTTDTMGTEDTIDTTDTMGTETPWCDRLGSLMYLLC